MTLDQEIRDLCRDKCAEFGDPPCWRLDDNDGIPFAPCSECLAETGTAPEVKLDPDAVIRNLI